LFSPIKRVVMSSADGFSRP